MEYVTLLKHRTSGGAIYLTDNEHFQDANIIIRLDGGAELIKCDTASIDKARLAYLLEKQEVSGLDDIDRYELEGLL